MNELSRRQRTGISAVLSLEKAGPGAPGSDRVRNLDDLPVGDAPACRLLNPFTHQGEDH